MTNRKNIRYILFWILWACLLCVFLFMIFLLIPYKLEDIQSTKVFDRYWNILYDVRNDYRKTKIESLEDISEDFLDNFLIKKEDKNFWKHNGVDGSALVRAIYKTIFDRETQWASTIDQQVIKLSQQAFERSIFQKIEEIVLAWNINIHYKKKDILLYYLNNLFFENGVKWIWTACSVFFDSSCAELSQWHLIYLYAKSKFPSKKSVVSYASIMAEKYNFTGYLIEDFKKIENEEDFWINTKARHFVNYVLNNKDINRDVNNKDINRDVNNNNNIYTNFDTEIYKKVENALTTYNSYLEKKKAWNSCVIVMKEWKIVSMNSWPAYGNQWFYINNCLQKRQVGSAIKPFLYLQAFDKLWYDQNTKIVDEPVNFFSDYGMYSPKNFDLKYHWEISLATALGNSFNVPAIKILHKLWLREFYQFLSKIWKQLNTDDQRNDDFQNYWLALWLGVKEISPLDFTKMWQIFNSSFCIKNNNKFCKDNEKNISKIKNILSDNQNRIISFGQYNWFDVPLSYGKSWTSRHFVDAWICGGKKDYTICMWAGNHTTEPMLGGGHEILGPVWYEVLMWL